MLKEMIYLFENGFILASIIIGALMIGAYLIRIIKDASSIDIKKSKREHSLYQLSLLEALKKSSEGVTTLLPAQTDSPDEKAIKEDLWRSHGVSVAAIEPLKKEYESKTIMPILAVKSFANGEKALKRQDNKITAVRYSKTSKAFLTSTLICYGTFVFLFILGVNSLLSEGENVRISDSGIQLLSFILSLSFFISYITFQRFKQNLNAIRFLNLTKHDYKIDGFNPSS